MSSNVLFVCARNRLRSPAAECLFAEVPHIEVASAGLNSDAEVAPDANLGAWADIIFVMEETHRERLMHCFGRGIVLQRVIRLDIPDRFDYMDPELIRPVRQRVPSHLL